jgi:hypothetical protein
VPQAERYPMEVARVSLRSVRLRHAVAVSALVLLAGCRVDLAVEIDADADGTGRVRATATLDRAAAQRVPDLAGQLRTADLTAAGWEVSEPERGEDGSVSVEAVRRFRSPQEATQAVEELTGPGGPFRDFRVRRSRSFLRTRTAFEGRVDLANGIEAFSDEALKRRFQGSALGFDPAELQRQLGAPLDGVFRFRVVARLPGEVSSNAPAKAGTGAEWQPRLGEDVRLQATAVQWNLGNIGAVTVSAASGLAFLLVMARRLRRRGG